MLEVRLLAQAGDDRSHFETHAFWWFMFVVVVFDLFLIVLATVAVVLYAFHCIGNMHEKELHKSGTCFLRGGAMSRL